MQNSYAITAKAECIVYRKRGPYNNRRRGPYYSKAIETNRNIWKPYALARH